MDAELLIDTVVDHRRETAARHLPPATLKDWNTPQSRGWRSRVVDNLLNEEVELVNRIATRRQRRRVRTR